MSEILDKIKEQFRNAKIQLMYQYEQGANAGKALKKAQQEKIKKVRDKKDDK